MRTHFKSILIINLQIYSANPEDETNTDSSLASFAQPGPTNILQMENDDGLWVRLSTESIREHCTSSWFPTEAWCLQYNQHLGKTLLHPILESSSTKALMEQVDQSSPTTSDANEENENTIDYFDFMKTDRPTDEASSANDGEELVAAAKLLQITEQPPTTDESPANAAAAAAAAANINIANLNQSNIGAAIAGVVGGGAKKMQALQKWLKGDSFEENESPRKRKSEGHDPRSLGNRSFDRSRSVSPEIFSRNIYLIQIAEIFANILQYFSEEV